MQRIIAFILILVFISSTTATLFEQLSSYKANIELNDSEDSDNEETTKEPFFAKDKLMLFSYSFSYSLKNTQEYYLTHQYFLPTPLAIVEIIPPEFI